MDPETSKNPPAVADPRVPETAPQGVPRRSSAWAWVAVVCILVAGVLFVVVWSSNFAARTIRKTGSVLADVASAFRRGTITMSFASYATTIQATHYLQFATLRQREVFTRTDEARTGFGYIPLPDVVVEARAPVEYTYFLDLNAPWQFIVEGNVIFVLAPDIQFNKPAVDVSAIDYEVRKGSLIRDTTLAETNLKKSISDLAQQRARDNISLVREMGRKQTADFVEKWLMKSFSDGAHYAVKVYFPDEPAPPNLKQLTPRRE